VRDAWRARRLELLGATIWWAFVAWPLLRAGSIVSSFDSYTYSAPNDAVTFRAFRSFRLPQWNPDIFGGALHLANPQAGVFDPLKWPFAWMDAERAVVLITALHLLVLTIGMVALAQRLRLRPPAGLAGAVVIMGSGMVAGKGLQYPQILVLSFLPWVLAGIDLVLDDEYPRRGRAVGLLAIPTALFLVAGHPQMTFIGLSLVATWTLSRLFARGAWRRLLPLAGGLALGAALAAAQLIPSMLALSGAVQRAGTTLDSPLYVLQRTLIPTVFLGDTTTTRLDYSAGTLEAMAYVGAAAAALALLGVVDALRRRREREGTIVLLAAGVVALLLAPGGVSPVYRLAREVVPLFNQARVPARWVIVVTIIVSILVMQGVDALVTRRADERVLAISGAIALVVALGIAVGPFPLPTTRAVLTWALAAGAVLLVGVLLLGPARKWPVVGALVVVGVIAVELGMMAVYSPLRGSQIDASFTTAKGAVVRFLERHPERMISLDRDRFDDPLYLREGLRPNVNVLFGIRSLDGYDGGPQVRKTWVEMIGAFTKRAPNPELTLRGEAARPYDPALFASQAVRWVLIDTSVVGAGRQVPGWDGPVATQGDLALYENPLYDGAAFVYHATRAKGENAGVTLKTMSDAALQRVALVEADGPKLSCTTGAAECDRTRSVVTRPTPEQINVRTHGKAGLLVVPEQADDGWSATVDGESVPVHRVDGFSLGVQVPAGRHRVEFTYRTPGLRAGLVISFLALLGVIFLIVDRRPRRRPSTTPDPEVESAAA